MWRHVGCPRIGPVNANRLQCKYKYKERRSGEWQENVFHIWVRQLLHARFNTQGKYDEQYDHREGVYYVSNDDLLDFEWPDACVPATCCCSFCKMPLLPTP